MHCTHIFCLCFGRGGGGDEGEKTLDDGGKEIGFDIGRFVNARRHAIRDEIKQEIFFTFGRVLKELCELCTLSRADWLWHHPQSRTLCHVILVCSLPCPHTVTPVQQKPTHANQKLVSVRRPLRFIAHARAVWTVLAGRQAQRLKCTEV